MSSGNSGHNRIPDSVDKPFDVVPYLIVSAVVLLAYGFELFNFHLTIDEELHLFGFSHIPNITYLAWISQGRWGMAVLNYFVLPLPVVPIVSLAIGLIGTVVGIWIFLRKCFLINRYEAAILVSVALTVPTLTFIFTFSVNAYGIGFGFAALGLSYLLLLQSSPIKLIGAILLASFAIGIYQSFAVVLAMLLFAHLTVNWQTNNYEFRAEVIKVFFLAIGALAFYFLISVFFIEATGKRLSYVDGQTDVLGFVNSPLERLSHAASNLISIVLLSPDYFGHQSKWLAALVALAIVLSILWPLYLGLYKVVISSFTISIGLILLALIASASTPHGPPLRAMLYIPFGVVIILALVINKLDSILKYLLYCFIALTIISNSVVINHLNASASIAEAHDRKIAHDINRTVRILSQEKNIPLDSLRLEVVGSLDMPNTNLSPQREVIGASFFEWDGGNPLRIAVYLRHHGLPISVVLDENSQKGLPVSVASSEDSVRVFAFSSYMPVWPNDGWIAIHEGVVILKFSEYTKPQKYRLCQLGVKALC